ncbi:MAG: killer suppression protein [Desulfobacula sp.]|jgi:plasmid maintenance system killer protein|uniref:type II toxin-antitoxin system RelE/ParE family toxin n=1 Tax=Desulfobacula sp. TaxID=2593537 RepID=UPI001D9CE7B2|nr:killer suppression protein [Desulfobacula sp.]MBT3486789.1 killer suppression protein [Desulfobacula sp.]MBT3806462.1 killer suppression protein [Desulfobacula sp.]MBT4026429.1 killer suppression protein [Desulfobacula sp.]MBT4201058.1 killer suppression protein [Desulfobacula sp.]
MDIFFRTKKLQKICSTRKVAIKELGANGGSKLMQRMAELNAANSLEDISHLPPHRLHELTGERKGQFSVDLKHPFRLLFIPINEPLPQKEDGGLDKTKIDEIQIIDIEDTHE